MKRILIAVFFLVGLCSQAQQQEKEISYLDYIGYAIDSTVYNGDGSYLNRLFDKESFYSKIFQESDDEEIQKFNKGFREGFDKSFNLGEKIGTDIGDYGSYDFLRSRMDTRGNQVLLFRLYDPDDGLNYHEYVLKNIDGEIKIVDIYIFMTGEYLSKTLSDIYNAALVSRQARDREELKKTPLYDLVKLFHIRKLIESEDYKTAISLYETFSPEGKKEKAYKLIAIEIAGNIDDKLYAKYIKEYEELFPDDASLYLVSIDGTLLEEKYDKTLEQINLLDIAVGGDPFLDYMRANVFYMKNDMAKAIEYIEVFNKNFEFYFDGYDVALTFYIEGGDPKKVFQVLDIMVEEFEISKEELKSTIKENFPEFAKRKDYISWSKT